MKIIIIDGVHNKEGTTTKLVQSFIKGVREKNKSATISHHVLIDEDIEPCRGCESCSKDQTSERWTCPIDDKATKIIDEALASDVVVFATPIYEYSVSSTMKKFLERCLPLARFWFGIVPRMKPIKGKLGIVLCSSGAPFPFNYLMGITRYPRFILKLTSQFFGCSDIQFIFAGGMAETEDTTEKYLKKAFDLGKKVA